MELRKESSFIEKKKKALFYCLKILGVHVNFESWLFLYFEWIFSFSVV